MIIYTWYCDLYGLFMAKYITNNIYFYRQKYIVFFVSNRKREIDGFKENIRDIGILYGKRDYDKSVTLYDCQNTFEKFVDLKPSLIRSITRHEPDSNKSSWPQNREMITFHTMQLQPHNFHVTQCAIQVRPFFFFLFPRNEDKWDEILYWALSTLFSLRVKNLLIFQRSKFEIWC